MTHQQFFDALRAFEENWLNQVKMNPDDDKLRWIYHGVRLTVSFVFGTLMRNPDLKQRP